MSIQNNLINELEELDGLIDEYSDIPGNNLLNVNSGFFKRKQKSRKKKNKYQEIKGIKKGEKEKILLETSGLRLLKHLRKKNKEK